MSRIRGANTRPEKVVRSLLHRLGYRFRLHPKGMPGRPDIVLPRYKVAIFVHGCFWHRHPQCSLAYTPKSRTDFWEQKFNDNVARDGRTQQALMEAGWKVVVIWECEVKETAELEDALKQALTHDPRRHGG